MNINITDRMLNCIVAKADIPNIIRNEFPNWVNGSTNIICPYHDDNNASLHISEDGRANCFGCGWSARNIVDMYAKVHELEYTDARMILYQQITNALPEAKAIKFHKNLTRNILAIKYIMQERRIDDEQISIYKLGFDPNTERITIPIFDQFGYLVNIRYMAWNKKSKYKVINDNGHGAARLYPEADLVTMDKVLLVEGEWDCLVGKTFGLPTITWTGGAGAWDHQYDWLFKNKHVFVLYDNDDAGRKGAQQAKEALQRVTTCSIIPPPSARGKDLSDWAREEPHLLRDIGVHMRNTTVTVTKQTRTCPCCGQTVPERKP